MRIFPDAPRIRNGDGFLPHQLALEHGHRHIAEALAGRAGKSLPKKSVSSLLLPGGTTTGPPQPGQPLADDAREASALSTGDAAPAVAAEPSPHE